MSLRFTVFGRVRAFDGDMEVDVGHARQRQVLAALLVEAGRSVTADGLIDRVWGERPPQRGRSTLHSYISRLRSVGVPVVAERGEYSIDIEPSAVDAHRFRDLVAEGTAATDDKTAAELLNHALRLSTEDALFGVDEPWAEAFRGELARLRFNARLDLNDIELRRRRHTQILPQLHEMADQQPLDERLSGQIMLALYRAGRQALAIEEYERIRTRLATELGVDPSPTLRAVYQEILTGDADIGAAAAAVPVPRQLPAAPPCFVGRADLLAQLDHLVTPAGGTAVISAIGGIGGVGKTWLALQWAERAMDRFPDGQLYVDLRGFGPGDPTAPDVALLGLLQALGIDSAVIPADCDGRAALYRSTTAGRRLLVVLDNAADTAQVTPLLPGVGGGSAVVITSRSRLTGLVASHGARPVHVDVLAEADARDLLHRQVDAARLAAEPAAVDDLVHHCAGLPLALGIVAARAATHPDLRLSELADELRDQASRLDGFDTGEIDLNLRAVFSWSLRSLPADAVELFTLLGNAPGADISLPAAAALAGRTASATRNLLRTLENASLVTRSSDGRYRMHDLVRLHASEQSMPAQQLADALLRVVDYYRLSTWRCDMVLRQDPSLMALEPLTEGVVPAEPATLDEAWAWYDAECACLIAAAELAADRGWREALTDILTKATEFRTRRGRFREWIGPIRRSIGAADRAGDILAGVRNRRMFASDAILGGQAAETVEVLTEALAMAEQLGDVMQRALTHHVMAGAWEYLHDDAKSIEHNLRVLELIEVGDQPTLYCRALAALGFSRCRAGMAAEAVADFERAVLLSREHGLLDEEANAIGNLAVIARQRGDVTGAVEQLEWVVDTGARLGDVRMEALYLSDLGECYQELGDVARARSALTRALTFYRRMPRGERIERIEAALAALPAPG